MATEIKNINTGTTKAVTLQMPNRGIYYETLIVVPEGGYGLQRDYVFNVADNKYPLNLSVKVIPNPKKDRHVWSLKFTTRAVTTDADDVVLSDVPISVTQTVDLPGLSGSFDSADLLVFLQNSWGLLFTDVASGAINSTVIQALGNGIPTIG